MRCREGQRRGWGGGKKPGGRIRMRVEWVRWVEEEERGVRRSSAQVEAEQRQRDE